MGDPVNQNGFSDHFPITMTGHRGRLEVSCEPLAGRRSAALADISGYTAFMASVESAHGVDLSNESVRYPCGHRDEVTGSDLVLVVENAIARASPTVKVLVIQPTCECEPFYRGASEPIDGSACIVDFARHARSAKENGGIEIVGPPPF